MLECLARVDEYVAGDETRFRSSRLIQDAVIRNLQTLAESSQRLSETLKADEPQVPWRAISGFRNILVHDYLGVDVDVIWQVVKRESVSGSVPCLPQTPAARRSAPPCRDPRATACRR